MCEVNDCLIAQPFNRVVNWTAHSGARLFPSLQADGPLRST
jgi:hypothetical protein